MKYLILFLFVSIIACKPKDVPVAEVPGEKQDTTLAPIDHDIPGLKHLWDTEKTLTTSESVLYDKTNNVLYVSCINGTPPDKKDKDGYIAQVGLDGKVIKAKWATGLSGPKGMGMSGTTMYVADIDRLVAIDMATGKISKTWMVKGAKFLNDVAVAADNTVYFTDSGTSSVYALKNGELETIIDVDTTLGGTNGVYVYGNRLMLAGMNSGKVYTMDITTHDVQQVADGIGAGDGIQPYKKGWIVSNWNGQVFYVGAEGEIMEILNSQEAKLNTADILVIEDKNLLLIPTFFGNTVAAYELVNSDQ